MATVDTRYIIAAGPVKLEVVDLSSVNTTSDTFTTHIARPLWALAGPISDASNTNNISTAVSGKTITIHDCPVANCGVIVVGF